MKYPVLLPRPKHVEFSAASKDVSRGVRTAENILPQASLIAVLGPYYSEKGLEIRANYSPAPGAEAYALSVEEEGISIEYGSEAGVFYALVTLRQMLEQSSEGKIYCAQISDKPDFAARGLMLDISRNKIPSLDTLKKIIDYAAGLKMNQFQLYMEGKSFYYPSLRRFYEEDCDVLTAGEILLLDAYCKERYIEFVPNQNCFGHMSEWLAEEELRPLAECPDGFVYDGVKMPPSTLDPSNPESLQLIHRQLDDLLPSFSSPKVNIGGDEPFELGTGKSGEACRKLGTGEVYFSFMRKIFSDLKERGKKAMMWGDVFKSHYERCKSSVPSDVTVLEWGYDADSFSDEVCGLYERAKIRYYLFPGTSLWNTVTGKTYNMRKNIKSAARLGKKHGAEGILVTDWGDGGTCQPFVCSLLPYATGGAYAWNAGEEQDEDALRYLDEVIFRDESGNFAEILADLGNYYRCADKDDANATKIFKTLYVQQTDCMNLTEGNYEPLFFNRDFVRLSKGECLKTLAYLEGIRERLKKVRLASADGNLYRKEAEWAAEYLIHGCKLGAVKAENEQITRAVMEEFAADLNRLNAEYEEIWRYRNRQTGLKQSMLRMKALYRKYLAVLG